MKKISILCLSLFCFLFSQSQVVYFKGSLTGAQASTSSTGSGVVIVRYDSTNFTLKVYGDFADLTTSISDAHIHRGEPGVSGPVVVPLTFTQGTAGSLTGDGTLTSVQGDSLLSGQMYVNVHTSTNPNGEIRAQLTRTTLNATTLLSGRLQSAQETPPNTSLGKGVVYALVDAAKDSIYVTGTYTGLTGAATNAHIHTAPPDSAGPVYLPIFHSNASSGAIHLADAIDAPHAATILAGGSYVNVHTTANGNGEIRAQLINNSTGRFYVGEFSGANEATPNASKGMGVVIVSYDPNISFLQLSGDYEHLKDTIVRANLVLPGATPDTILLTNSRDSIGTITNVGTTLSPAQATALAGGQAYINIITDSFKTGEIRANLTGTTAGETQAYAVKLTPGQEVPAATGAATGTAFVVMDKGTGKTYVTGGYQGLNSAPTRTYIRGGAVNDTSGSVFLDVTSAYLTTKKAGVFSGVGTVTQPQLDSMINGLAYLNVLSSGRPLGAVRGQLGNLILPLKLKYFNGYKQRNQIELVWETAEELNVNYFEVEQLNTQTNTWSAKGTVASKGNSNGSSYNFDDVPNTGGNKYLIYRLKMVDKDGKFTYSSLVKINFDQIKAELFIQTNPVVNGELKYTITGLSSSRAAEISIVDFNGRVVLRNTISSLTNNTLRLPKLSSGMYKMMVRIDDTLLQKTFMK